ncbi:MAG TPA: hypothetical protein DIT58_00420, partial [Porticoccaceae bacterium]|nr:hypothetical protein [Porticoccaceae bacterium]
MLDGFVADQPPRLPQESLLAELSEIGRPVENKEVGVEGVLTDELNAEGQEQTVGREELSETELPTEDPDPAIVEIFVEEADELLEQIEQAVQSWRENPGGDDYHEALIRELHTFKGGARVAGLIGLGTLSHDFETFIENWARQDTFPNEEFFDELLARYDALVTRLEQDKLAVTETNVEAAQQRADANLLPEPEPEP